MSVLVGASEGVLHVGSVIMCVAIDRTPQNLGLSPFFLFG